MLSRTAHYKEYTSHHISKTGLVAVVTSVLNVNIATLLLEARGHDVGLNGLEIDAGNLSVITVEDLGDLLESRATGLDVEDRDEDEFEENPALWLC
jgi:hypothetical protein